MVGARKVGEREEGLDMKKRGRGRTWEVGRVEVWEERGYVTGRGRGKKGEKGRGEVGVDDVKEGGWGEARENVYRKGRRKGTVGEGRNEVKKKVM